MSDSDLQHRLAAALQKASDTRDLLIGECVLNGCADVFRRQFSKAGAIIVADGNTFEAAGREIFDRFKRAGIDLHGNFVFDEPHLHAEMDNVERIEQTIRSIPVIPVAVGSGTINDLTKLAAHRCGRSYMCVATAASMDGYTAFGASITCQGSKQTFTCPAPRAVVADMNVIRAAPAEMNPAGYADLLAKVTAGADWILADTMGIEPIDPQGWALVQNRLREWISRPDDIRAGKPDALAGLMEGLLFTGLAMQWCKSSRPASGADHQFSHLWDMQDHRHRGITPSHGYKVGIGTLAATRLYEQILDDDLDQLDIAEACQHWPDLDEWKQRAVVTHLLPDLQTVALKEIQAKYVNRRQLADLLDQIKRNWTAIRNRLRQQLLSSREMEDMLRRAGAPFHPEHIGINTNRLRRAYMEAQQIRRRYTVLDLAMMTGRWNQYMDRLFSPAGAWRERDGTC